MRRLALLFALIALSASCRGARSPETARPIDLLRERAAAAPQNKELWLELSVAEHLYDGGEAKRARDALARAKAIGVQSIRLTFVEAEQHVLEARPKQALAAYLRLLSQVPESSDPLAPWLAEVTFSALLDMNDAVDDYRALVKDALSKLAPHKEKLGLTSAHQLAMQQLAHAMRAGDLAEAQSFAAGAGCLQQAEVAGPFGPRDLLGFDKVWPAEKPGPLAAEHDLGPGRGVQPTRSVETRRCVLSLGRGARDALPGTSIVRVAVDAKSAGAHALRVESPNSFVLWLDGKELVRADLRAQAPFGVHYVPVQLSQGAHELKVKVSSRHPNPALSLALLEADQDAVARTRLPKHDTVLGRYLASKLALSRGAAVTARELLRTSRMREPTAHWLVLHAAASLADPLRSGEQRRDLARALLRKAEQANDQAWYPIVGLANLEAAEGRTKEAIDALRSAAERFPDVIAIQTTLSEHLRQRGYVEEADRILSELHERMPKACAVLGLALSSARARGRMEDVAQLVPRLLACDATSGARFALLKAQRKYQEAAEELLRLRALAEPMDESQALESGLERARLMGDRAAELALREQRSKLWHDRPEPVLDRADLMVEEGKRKEAIAYLASSFADNPDTLFDLTRVHEALGGEELFVGFRKDGAQVIKEFEASGRAYAEPEVLVLDYTVVRIFEDGSSADLTHNILRMQSQEAVDRNGEFGVPDGARLLRLQTVKANGQRLEPDPIPEKSTWSLPNLSLGDYVEFETVRGETPSAGFPGGYLGNRFYFKSFEIPFDHTELVVVLPEGTEPVLDPRGPAPKVSRESKDGLTVLRWAEHESRPLREEPGSVSTREYVPSINLGIRVTWEHYIDSLRDLLADKDIADPEAAAVVGRLLGDARSAPASVRAEKLFRFVTEEIEPTSEVFGLAPAMLSARTGSRERILRYLLLLAGIPTELALVRGAEADHTAGTLPDPETFGYLLLRVTTEKGPVWLHAGARHAPFGYLPPQVRGEQALVLNAEAERATTPKSAAQADSREVDVEITLGKQGKAELQVRETHRGQSAVAWRNDLDDVPEAELSARFEESYASGIVPGGKLKSVAFEQRGEPEAPLVIRYVLDVDSLGHRVGEELRVPSLFPASLQAQFSREASRTTPLLVAPGVTSTVRVRVLLPKGAKVQALPKPAKLAFTATGKTAEQARFELSVKEEPQQLTITRQVRVPLTRIAPSNYASFASFSRAVDLNEASELAITLP